MVHVDVFLDSPSNEEIGKMLPVGTLNDRALPHPFHDIHYNFKRILLLYHNTRGRCFFEAWTNSSRGCVPTYRPGALRALKAHFEPLGVLE